MIRHQLRFMLVLTFLAGLILWSAGMVLAGAGQWSSQGPVGGQVRALAIAPGQEQVVYAGVRSGGVFKSENGGASWTVRSNGLLSQTLVSSLAVSVTDASVVYAGTEGDGVYKTTDGGLNWTEINTGIPSSSVVMSLALHPNNVLYAGTFGAGVFASDDSGSNWTEINTGLTDVEITTLLLQGDTLYAGTDNGRVFEYDGVNWTDISTGSPTLGGNEEFIRGLAAAGTDLYAATQNKGVYKRSGGDWTAVNTNLPGMGGRSLVIDPTGILYVGLSGNGVYKTTDGGANWTAATNGLDPTFDSIQALALHPSSPATLYAGDYDLGVYKTINGGSDWSLSSFINSLIYDVAVNPQTLSLVYAARSPGVVKSTDFGYSWTDSSSGLPEFTDVTVLAIHPAAPATLYAGTMGNEVYESTNGGGTWTVLGSALPAAIDNIVIDPDIPALYASINQEAGVYRWDGASWVQFNGPPDQALPVGKNVNDLVIDTSTNPATLYAGTSEGLYKASSGTAAVWNRVDQDLSDPRILAIALDPTTPATLYVATLQGGLSKSTNGGRNWQPINNAPTPLENYKGVDLAVDPETPETLYAALEGAGVYRSLDGGDNWAPFNTGLTSNFVLSLAIDPVMSSNLYAGTRDGGVFVYNLPVLSLAKTVEPSEATPGQAVTYTLVISNVGLVDATGAVISDTLPAGLEFAGPVTILPTQPGAGTAASAADLPTLVSNLTVQAGQTLTVTLPVTVSSSAEIGAIITNTATITESLASLPATGVISLTVVNFKPVLSLVKTVDPSEANPGQLITYSLIVSNSSPVDATGAVISDTLPAGLEFAGPVTILPTQPGAGTAASAADLPTLVSNLTVQAGQTLTVTLPVTVSSGVALGTIIENTATITETTGFATATAGITFTAVDSTPPGPFALLAPAANTLIKTQRPYFDWQDAPDNLGVISYTLTVTGSGSELALQALAQVTTTQSHFTTTVDLAAGEYSWTVHAYDAGGNTSQTSNGTINFTVAYRSYLPVLFKDK